MKHTYVPCPSCSHWSNDTRRESLCGYCKNVREVINPQERLCNMCGECLCPHEEKPSGKWTSEYPHGLVDAKIDGGYESYHLFDMSRYVFSFCEKCLREMFNKCKIPPTVLEMSLADGDTGTERDSYAEDRKHYEYCVWKDDGGHHQAYLNKKCNVIQDCPNTAVYTILLNKDFTEDCCCEDHKEERMYSNSTLTKFIPNVLKPFL